MISTCWMNCSFTNSFSIFNSSLNIVLEFDKKKISILSKIRAQIWIWRWPIFVSFTQKFLIHFIRFNFFLRNRTCNFMKLDIEHLLCLNFITHNFFYEFSRFFCKKYLEISYNFAFLTRFRIWYALWKVQGLLQFFFYE